MPQEPSLTARLRAVAPLRDLGPGLRRVLLLGLGVAAYLTALTVALQFNWYPSSLPGYVIVGLTALVAAATTKRFPLASLTVVSAITVAIAFGPVPGDWYVRAPELLVPLAVTVFISVSNGLPVFAPAASFAVLAVLTIVPWQVVVDSWLSAGSVFDAFDWAVFYDRSTQFGYLVGCALVVAAALALQHQRRATAQLAARNRELVALRAEEAVRIAERERTRIARDVHDEVAHHVAALVIGAQAAVRVAGQHPDRLVAALDDVVLGGKDVLTRIRTVVRVLKAAPVGPLADATGDLDVELEAMAARLRAIGYQVDCTVLVHGELPAPQRIAVLGVVQECLTNTMLHSSAEEVRVAITEGPTAWQVVVTDPGPAAERFPDVPRGGAGIANMRERIVGLGGVLVTGHDAAGTGWAVRAELPRGGASFSVGPATAAEAAAAAATGAGATGVAATVVTTVDGPASAGPATVGAATPRVADARPLVATSDGGAS
nr:histidine kinase [Frigoribacterium sp. VKM Ac-2530]